MSLTGGCGSKVRTGLSRAVQERRAILHAAEQRINLLRDLVLALEGDSKDPAH